MVKKVNFNYILIKMVYDFKSWKKNKKKKGQWLSRNEFLMRRRNHIRRHEELFAHFLKYQSPLNDKKEDQNDREEALFKREIILDTETTGLSEFDKIVEISLLELIDGVKTGRRLHYFFNPKIKISKRAVEIHNITNEKLKNAPLFSNKAEEIIKFIGNATIIAHNASFDRRMLNQELIDCGWEIYPQKRFIDTLEIARFLYPKVSNSQDALCQRFNIDNYNRVTTGIHSAYEDTIQLYFIYKNLNEALKKHNLNAYNFKIKHPAQV